MRAIRSDREYKVSFGHGLDINRRDYLLTDESLISELENPEVQDEYEGRRDTENKRSGGEK